MSDTKEDLIKEIKNYLDAIGYTYLDIEYFGNIELVKNKVHLGAFSTIVTDKEGNIRPTWVIVCGTIRAYAAGPKIDYLDFVCDMHVGMLVRMKYLTVQPTEKYTDVQD